jgi:hypothetical protein
VYAAVCPEQRGLEARRWHRIWVIPKSLARTLEVDGGEKPIVRFDAESRTVELDFATPDDTPGESLRNQSALDD